MGHVLTSVLVILCLSGFSLAQGSDEKDDVVSARRAAKEATKNQKHCAKIGFPASLSDNRCYTFYPYRLSTWGKGFSDGLAKVTIKGKAGFIDTTGKLVIPARLRDAGSFSQGLAPFETVNGKWGFIDRQGKVIIPAKFDWAIGFKEDLALVQVGERWGFIDRRGLFIIQPKFEEAESFSEGFAAVGWYDNEVGWTASIPRTGKWARRFINKTGAWAMDDSFDIISRGFDGGMAIVSRSLGYSEKYKGMISASFVIDKLGRDLWELKSASTYWFSDDVIVIETERRSKGGSLYNFQDRSGKLLCGVNFENPTGFSDGLSGVRLNNRYGFINKKCEFVIEPQYSDTNGFSEGFAWVEDGSGRQGFIDNTGKWVFETKFDWVDSFSGGFALVLDGAKAGYIDRNGTVIWRPTK